MLTIDLNADIGEGCGDDEGILACVSSASIACGGHAGDEASMRAALRLCARYGVAAGAHPSYPDREHFGRRVLDIGAAQAAASLLEQLQTLQRLAAEEGVALRHLKPHGALYNRAADDAALAAALAQALRDAAPQLALMGLAGGALLDAGRAAGLRVIAEGFADRGYGADARLLPRGQAGALLGEEQAEAQLLSLVQQGGLRAADGSWLLLSVGSVCLHGDSPGALALARRLHAALRREGVALGALA